MLYTSKGFALVLSVAISLTTGLLMLLFRYPGMTTLAITCVVSLVVSFVITYSLIESVIFGPLGKTKQTIRKLTSVAADPFAVEEHGKLRLDEVLNEMSSLTEAKQREIDQLRRQESFRKDFIADVSHELKTPIFAAQGFVHTLLDGAVEDKDVRKKFLKKAAKSLDGLDILVQDLLMLSQIETGKVRMHFGEIDLYALTEEVFDQLKSKSLKKEITLSLKGTARKVLAYGDSQRIAQVMTNLISNAINHSSPEGKVEVSFTVKNQSVVTLVRDFGEGIPEEHISRIFERFYRVDKSRSREKGGTGLGLAIVKHILEVHKSKPKVKSTPGKGSTFSFRLPQAQNEAPVNETDSDTTD